MILQLYEALQRQLDVDIWIDTENMSGSCLAAMAEVSVHTRTPLFYLCSVVLCVVQFFFFCFRFCLGDGGLV